MPTHFSALRHLFRIFVQAWSDPHVHILMVLAATLLGMGTVFFHFAEGWRWLDAFYFSAVTLSTVGYGDFHPVTSIGKLVTVAFVFVGAGVFVDNFFPVPGINLFLLSSLIPLDPGETKIFTNTCGIFSGQWTNVIRNAEGYERLNFHLGFL